MRFRGVFLSAVLLAAGSAAEAQDYRQRAGGAAPTSVRMSSGRVWQKIPLQYLDVRTVAALLGAPVLPTEAEVFGFAPRFGGYGAGGYGGGYAGGFGGAAGPGYGAGGGFRVIGDRNSNSLLLRGRGTFAPGVPIFGDPNTNSLFVDP